MVICLMKRRECKAMTAIQTFGLTKKYKDKTAVHPLDLIIDQGELFA